MKRRIALAAVLPAALLLASCAERRRQHRTVRRGIHPLRLSQRSRADLLRHGRLQEPRELQRDPPDRRPARSAGRRGHVLPGPGDRVGVERGRHGVDVHPARRRHLPRRRGAHRRGRAGELRPLRRRGEHAQRPALVRVVAGDRRPDMGADPHAADREHPAAAVQPRLPRALARLARGVRRRRPLRRPARPGRDRSLRARRVRPGREAHPGAQRGLRVGTRVRRAHRPRLPRARSRSSSCPRLRCASAR